MPTAAAAASGALTPCQRHPHPGERVPRFAWPTLTLGAVALTVFVAATVAVVGAYSPVWLTIPLSTAAIYAMFMVAHEGLHNAISTVRWVNPVVARFGWIFILPYICLPAFTYAHWEHHRNANDGDRDPDMFATHGPGWQLPFRWLTMDAFYAVWYFRRLPARLRKSRRQPMAEVIEGALVFPLSMTGLGLVIVNGHFETLLIAFFIPQRLALLVIGWWFDWLPHHGLTETQRQNRYRATRLWVGMECLLLPLMLSQTYHLVHHLHPALPFYRLWAIWLRNEDAYLDHDPELSTVFGKRLAPDDYRRWRRRKRLSPSPGVLASPVRARR